MCRRYRVQQQRFGLRHDATGVGCDEGKVFMGIARIAEIAKNGIENRGCTVGL